MRRASLKRFIVTISFIIILAAVTYLLLIALSEEITFFYRPSQIPVNKHNVIIRVGGFVKKNSVNNFFGHKTKFIITDNIDEIPVIYTGILPSLFRENQEVIVKGKYNGNIFKAQILLAKHDENYRPPVAIK